MTQPHPIPDHRCQHLTGKRRRCRLSARPDSPFCSLHAALARTGDDVVADLLAPFADGPAAFKSFAALNQFLAQLLILQVQDRISPRRAAVMAYNVNLLLRTIAAAEHSAAKNAKPPVIEYVMPNLRGREPSSSSSGSSTQ